MVMEMSKTYQYRKVMKPLLERKRRARINKCLDDLKDLMVECLQQEGEHVTRLEKADILELTVEHMRKLKRRGQILMPLAGDRTKAHIESFRTGYLHAADQITQVLLQKPATDEVNDKIMNFLSTRLVEMQPPTQQTPQQHVYSPALPSPASMPNERFALYPAANATSAAISAPDAVPPFFSDMCRMSMHVAQRLGGHHTSNMPDELIDVTTVDYNSNNSNSSFESNNSGESVWRPW